MFWGKHGFAVPVWMPLSVFQRRPERYFQAFASHKDTESLSEWFLWLWQTWGALPCVYILHGLVLTTTGAQQVTLTGTYPKSVTSLTGHQEKVAVRAAGDGRAPDDTVSQQRRGQHTAKEKLPACTDIVRSLSLRPRHWEIWMAARHSIGAWFTLVYPHRPSQNH